MYYGHSKYISIASNLIINTLVGRYLFLKLLTYIVLAIHLKFKWLLQEPSEKIVDGAFGVQPCSTLFLANLGPNCNEDELKQVLSQ